MTGFPINFTLSRRSPGKTCVSRSALCTRAKAANLRVTKINEGCEKLIREQPNRPTTTILYTNQYSALSFFDVWLAGGGVSRLEPIELYILVPISSILNICFIRCLSRMML